MCSSDLAFSLLGTAHAEWTRVDHPSSDVILYVEKESHKPTGRGSVVMWHLVDYSAAQDYNGKPFRSVKGQDEYNCARGLRRDMLHLLHEDAMGNSHMVHAAYKPGPWTAPAEGSIEYSLLRTACADK